MRLKLACLLMILTTTAVTLPAATVSYVAHLNGPAEEPPVPSPGTGFAMLTLDDIANTILLSVDFSGLIGTTTASHIHVINGPGDSNLGDTLGPVATTVPTFPGFPLGVTSGSYTRLFDMTDPSSYNPSFVTNSGDITAAQAQLFMAIREGRAYLNVHSSFSPGGEIRDFFAATPEPGTYGLMAGSLVTLAFFRRRRAAAR